MTVNLNNIMKMKNMYGPAVQGKRTAKDAHTVFMTAIV